MSPSIPNLHGKVLALVFLQGFVGSCGDTAGAASCLSAEEAGIEYGEVIDAEELSLLQRRALITSSRGQQEGERRVPAGEAAHPWSIAWAAVAAAFVLLPAFLIVFIASVGALPPPRLAIDEARAKLAQKSPWALPPGKVLAFSGAVLIGIAANITAVLSGVEDVLGETGPSAIEVHFSMVEVLVGALVGIAFFMQFPVQAFWRAYMVQAYLMAFGNLALVAAIYFRMPFLFGISRIGIGFQCGCLYNVGLAFVHFSEGTTVTASLLMAQFFISIGFLLGPILGAVSAVVGHLLGHVAECEALLPICFMAVSGTILLVCLLSVAPPPVARAAAPAGEPARSRSGDREALLCLLWNFVSISMFQCMLLESGAVFFLEQMRHWPSLDAALVMGNVGAANALVLLLASRFVAGRFRNEAVMRILELAQFAAVFVILLSVGVRRPTEPMLPPVVLGAFAFLHYCASCLHGVFGLAFCLDRAVPGTSASRENLLLVGLLALCGGICVSCGAGHWLWVQLEEIESDPRLYVIALLLAILFQSISRISASGDQFSHKCQ